MSEILRIFLHSDSIMDGKPDSVVIRASLALGCLGSWCDQLSLMNRADLRHDPKNFVSIMAIHAGPPLRSAASAEPGELLSGSKARHVARDDYDAGPRRIHRPRACGGCAVFIHPTHDVVRLPRKSFFSVSRGAVDGYNFFTGNNNATAA